MKTVTRFARCPVCGRDINNDHHSRMGERASPDGPVEYWACFKTSEVFSLKLFETSSGHDSFDLFESA